MPRRRSPAVAIKLKNKFAALNFYQTRAGENSRKTGEGKRGFCPKRLFALEFCE